MTMATDTKKGPKENLRMRFQKTCYVPLAVRRRESFL